MQIEGSPDYFRGSRIALVPKDPGIYAWYYKPRIARWEAIAPQLLRLLDSSVQIRTVASLRYGLQLRSSAEGRIYYQSDRRELADVIDSMSEAERTMVVRFLTEEAFLSFSRPLYIGIARNLNKRVYDQHFSGLQAYWDDDSEVARYLRAEPAASVEEVASALQIKRSFALEARTRGIAPGDLLVYARPTSAFAAADTDEEDAPDDDLRRSLERVLQLLADPVCGKR